MGDWSDYRNLGRQGPPARTDGMWPNGEPAAFRDTYDAMCRYELDTLTRAAGPAQDALLARRLDAAKTKTCYNCRGTGKAGGKQCTACNGTGTVPAA